jgi:hypothetical protein
VCVCVCVYSCVSVCVCEKVGMDGRTPKLSFELLNL